MDHVIFKTGLVWESKPGYAKVHFDEDDDDVEAGSVGFTTDWLPQIFHATVGERIVTTLKKDTQVECLMQSNLKIGVILGASYNNVDLPPTSDPDTYIHEFPDGTVISYKSGSGSDGVLTATVNGDVSLTVSGKLTANVSGDTELTTNKLKVTGNIDVTGEIKATGEISSQTEVKAGASQIPLSTHVHPGVQSGSSSTGLPTP